MKNKREQRGEKRGIEGRNKQTERERERFRKIDENIFSYKVFTFQMSI